MARRRKAAKRSSGSSNRAGLASGIGRVLAPTASIGKTTKPPTIGGPTAPQPR